MSRFVHKEVRITVHSIIEDADGRKRVGYSAKVIDEDDKDAGGTIGASVRLGESISVLMRDDKRLAINGSAMGMAAPVWDDDGSDPAIAPSERLRRIRQAASDMVGHDHWDYQGTRGANCNYCIVQRGSMQTINAEINALLSALAEGSKNGNG